MRLALTLALSLSCAAAAFAAPEHRASTRTDAASVAVAIAPVARPVLEPSAGVISPAGSILLHLHPLPWRPPASLALALGMRSDPEFDMAPADRAALLEDAAARRAAIAALRVQRRADGSASLNLGGLVRAYTVATIGADGRVTQECVHSEQRALDCVDAGAPLDAATARGATTPAPAPQSPRREK